ncbi:MAG TPA: response regulator transcription factor [Thermoanaerobaculaceae bacterium]|nr:response regulator transcription factor [Thermoanaerobaculaceae bacterium]
MGTLRVLIVDDDAALGELLGEYLEQEGYVVDTVRDGETGATRATSGACDLVVLDVVLPGLGGFDVLRRIRAVSTVPVIMLTARGDDVDRIVGLELGADDYLPKPFNPRELVARMRAVLRRVDGEPEPGTRRKPRLVEVDDVTLDLGARTVRRAGEELRLTGLEFSLLEALVRAAGEVVRRSDLYREVLGRRATSYDRSLDVHVSNLRRKLGLLPGERERIKTVRGVGFQYVLGAGQGTG